MLIINFYNFYILASTDSEESDLILLKRKIITAMKNHNNSNTREFSKIRKDIKEIAEKIAEKTE